MKHARDDYNRIQDPAVKDESLLGKGCTPIADEEPVFLVRAKDKFAPHVLLDYAARCDESALPEMAETCRQHAGAMFRWQEQHGFKLPDLPVPPTPVHAKPKGGR